VGRNTNSYFCASNHGHHSQIKTQKNALVEANRLYKNRADAEHKNRYKEPFQRSLFEVAVTEK